jgi:Fic family protein
VQSIREQMQSAKSRLRETYPRLYSQDLINNLFRHPYTKIEFIERDLKVSRQTATTYLNKLCNAEFVRKMKVGRTNFYINEPLFRLLAN